MKAVKLSLSTACLITPGHRHAALAQARAPGAPGAAQASPTFATVVTVLRHMR